MATLGSPRELIEGDVIRAPIERNSDTGEVWTAKKHIRVSEGEEYLGEVVRIRITDRNEDEIQGTVAAPCVDNPHDSSSTGSSSSNQHTVQRPDESRGFGNSNKRNLNNLLNKNH